MKIIGVGLTGLIGTRLVELLGSSYAFENISSKTGVDITDQERVYEAITRSDASIVIHLAAKTDVDGCEKDKKTDQRILGLQNAIEQNTSWRQEKTAWAVNVIGTKNIVDACVQSHKKLIYFSTDFVFNGKDTPVTGYTEEDTCEAINWYGQTKLEGEKIVQSSQAPWVIIRTAYPYRANFTKTDFIRIILQRLQEGKQVAMVTDHIMTPTYIDDICMAIDALIKQEQTGIYHVVGSQFITPYEVAMELTKTFALDSSLIHTTTREEFFSNRALRPFKLQLNNAKIKQLGVTMKTFKEGLLELKKQRVL